MNNIKANKNIVEPFEKPYDMSLDSRKEIFDKVYQKYKGHIYNYVLKLNYGNTYQAEEILQMTFLKLWEKRDTLYDYDETLSYLYVTAKHILFNMLEHEMIEHIYRDYVTEHTAPWDNSTEERVQYQFMMESLMKIVDQMPPMRRKVFLMSKFENKTYGDIASDLNISVSTVEKHLIIAMRFMRAMMKDYFRIIILLLSFIAH